ncbi:MAG: glutathione peroxidase [Ginsengibacter sp.]
MTLKRKIITSLYPLQMKLSKLTGKGILIYKNKYKVQAPQSFYSLKATQINGEEISFEKFRNKKVLVVNLASLCGYTPQYAALQKLYEQTESLVILGFPSNNFGSQEPGSDDEINSFCKINYGVTFPLFKKNDVIANEKQPVYQWLTDKNKNGWNDEEPQWNFYKYLVDEKGVLQAVFSSSVSPMDIDL